MSNEISRLTQAIANSPDLLAYEGAVAGTVGGLAIAAVEDVSVHDAPIGYGIGLSIGIVLCAAGVARVVQHAYEHWKATPSRTFS